ncbi:MAG TPA: thermonuclease family protein [Candidatus Paceibacterota bacterium]|nr:thermonuclease family protein [Candidatus Paceibacterota bacterium]
MRKFHYLTASAAILIGIALIFSWIIESFPSPEQKAHDLIVDLNAKAGLKSQIEISADGNSKETYRVQRVVDGDTLVVDISGSEITLRLIGVNTPETVDPRKPVECFGKEASAQTTSLLAGQNVLLGFDSSQGNWDKYNRLLTYVYREDGLFINKYLIENGYGHEYTYNTPYKFQEEFDEAEEYARENKKGLWAPEACKEFVETQNTGKRTEPIETDGLSYTCAVNSYNCSDFENKAQAQNIYLACGGLQADVHKLDADRDGEACE